MPNITRNYSLFSLKLLFIIAVLISLTIALTSTIWGTYVLRKQLLEERKTTIELLLKHTSQVLTPQLKYKVEKEIKRVLEDLLQFDFINGARVTWQEPRFYKDLREIDKILGKKNQKKNPKLEIFVGKMKGKIISYNFGKKEGINAKIEVAIDDTIHEAIVKKALINFTIVSLTLAIILCLLLYLYYYFVTIPILNLARHIKRIREEKTLTPFTKKIKGPKEIEDLLEAFNELVESVNKYRESLEKAIKQWKEEARRAENASQAKTKFLANVSHEIRTPMSAALGMVELLKEADLPEKEQKKLLHLETALKSLKELIDETLNFAKLEAGKEELHEEVFNLKEFCEECIQIFSQELVQKGIQMELNFSENLPQIVKGDRTKIRQILINLLSNAIKFTDKGKISLTVEKIREGENFFFIRFCVKDTGKGIAPENLERIFTPYERLEETFDRPYLGTGLGLAISERLAKLLGGKLWAESKGLGKGATFCLEVPLKKAASDEKSIIAPPKKLKGHVLLAEDNPVNQLYLKKTLQKLGLEVKVASDGLEALEMAEKHEFDLLILDILMPGIDGLEVAKKLREKGFDKPIIALTAHVVAEIERKAQRAGFNDFLEKPITRKELSLKLAKWLS
ncbi:HAMP domain-containing hybrid sensor histidine kinase/response regulator [Thermodesulfatator atlanticus]|uniref:HAMP domain-containing hybrid sensor histidine kinase/response regulator n=1 Tax=Thermodesulfatator atlanticus TaxID=501497 RepID=UPI0003B5ABCF|nr:response regulator [Thermodesulfatator atlanticus]